MASAQTKISAVDRNRFIGWVAQNKARLEGLTLSHMMSVARQELDGGIPQIKTFRQIVTDLGIAIKAVPKGGGSPDARSSATCRKIRALARIIRHMTIRLGDTPSDDLDRLAGIKNLDGRFERAEAEKSNGQLTLIDGGQ